MSSGPKSCVRKITRLNSRLAVQDTFDARGRLTFPIRSGQQINRRLHCPSHGCRCSRSCSNTCRQQLHRVVAAFPRPPGTPRLRAARLADRACNIEYGVSLFGVTMEVSLYVKTLASLWIVLSARLPLRARLVEDKFCTSPHNSSQSASRRRSQLRRYPWRRGCRGGPPCRARAAALPRRHRSQQRPPTATNHVSSSSGDPTLAQRHPDSLSHCY